MIKFRGKAIYAEEWVEGSLIDFPEYKGREIIPAEGTSYLDAIDIYPDTLQVMTTDGWADIADVEVVRKAVSVSLPIEEVALHAADDWFDTAKLRSDVRADLKSYYEGYRDAMRFCQGNGC